MTKSFYLEPMDSSPVVRYYIETYGCAANQADSELMESILSSAGYARSSLDEADFLIINTCGVKSPTENKIVHRIKELSRTGKPLIVAGCLPKINWDRLVSETSFNVALTPYTAHRVLEAVREARRGAEHVIIDGSRPVEKPLFQGARRASGLIGVIEVEEGCNFQCSFCATKFARGTTYSYSPESIIGAVKKLVGSGVLEVRLTGQDVAAYHRDGVDLPELVRRIVREVGGVYRIRVGMMTPVYAYRIRRGLAGLLALTNVYKFLHIPVQTGSDRVLRLMGRGHKISLFRDLVSYLRREFGDYTLATDIIVGHPGETEEDFKLTLRLLREVGFDVVNLSKFGSRPGTRASLMKQIPSNVVAERSREAYDVCLEVMEKRNSRWVGWEGRAFVVEKGTKAGTWIARNDWYKPIVVRGGREVYGKIVEVRVEGYSAVRLDGRLVRVHEAARTTGGLREGLEEGLQVEAATT